MDKYKLPYFYTWDEINKVDLHLWVTTDTEDYKKFKNIKGNTCKFVTEENQTIHGETYIFVRKKWTKEEGALVYINVEDSLRHTSFTLVNVVSHEAVHVADSFFRKVNAVPDIAKNNENYAMLVGWAAEQIHKTITQDYARYMR